MKKIFTILILSSLFAGELEVEGGLKVSGNIDAQNNPIKNVGIPQELTDAINGNVLQDALRDEATYEYKFIYLAVMTVNPNTNGQYSDLGYYILGQGNGTLSNLIPGGTSYINLLSLEGWFYYQTLGPNIAVLRKPIEE